MEINIQSEIGTCQEFMADVKAAKEPVSIVVSPLKVTAEDDSKNIRVTNGCNMWQACRNRACHFSAEARKLPRMKKAGA